LRETHGLTQAQTTEVSRAVFDYYRWFGWLEPARPLEARLRRALELARGFAERPQSFSDEKLLARTLPGWINSQAEVTAAWVRTLQGPSPLWLRARSGDGARLARNLVDARVGPFPEAVLYLGQRDLFRNKEFQSGRFEIQDIASQAVGFLCDPRAGEIWWDACAGEGGKTLHLSDLMKNQGQIWATDRAAWRLKRLKLRAARARCFNYQTALWDGSAYLPTKTKFHGILVDAPCSGVGTWQRNPHARWTTTPDDVLELAAIQKRLLMHALCALRPGGKLIYAVCTLTRAETVEVADLVDRDRRDLVRLPLPDPVHPGQPPASRRWIWPQDLGGNGMFVAAWRKEL
jgi:16S rRNA (cytosine967-C5)-methyltransferase